MLKILINNLITGIRLLLLSMCCAGVTFLYEEVLTAELNRTDGIQFNEILASNLTGLKDEDGDTSDWLEIENIKSQPVNLSGYSLTDNARVRRKWPLPDQDIPRPDQGRGAARGRLFCQAAIQIVQRIVQVMPLPCKCDEGGHTWRLL